MSYGSAIKKTKAQGFESNTIDFQVSEDILFPKICLICGNNTEDQYSKTIYGANSKNYILGIPVCAKCTKNINIQTGFSSKNGKIILISSIFGLVIGIILYILAYSIFLSISVFVLVLSVSIVKYRSSIKNKVKLNDYLAVRLSRAKGILTFDFLNEYYARHIIEINSKKDSSEETVVNTE